MTKHSLVLSVPSVVSRLWDRWMNLRVLTKTVWSQSLLVLAPAALCFLMVLAQGNAAFVASAADTGLEQCTYMLRGIDTVIRKCEAASNTVAANTALRELLSREDRSRTAELRRLVDTLLRYNTEHFEAITSIKPYSTVLSSVNGRGLFPFWQQERTLYFITPDELTAREWMPFYTEGRRLGGFVYSRVLELDGQRIGVLETTVDFAMIRQTLMTLQNALKGTCLLYGPDGALLYGDYEDAGVGILAQLPADLHGIQNSYMRLDRDSLLYVAHSDTLPFTLVATQKLSSLPTDFHIPWETVVFCVMIILACLIFSTSLMYAGVTKRLLSLSAHMNSTHTLENPIPDPNPGGDEIGLLVRNYNDMLVRVSELAHRANEATLLSQKAAYTALQAQIQPHMLYNTIETLRMKAESNDDDEMSELLYAFGRMLRLGISDRGHVGSIATEFEHVTHYLTLQKLRLGERLEYEIAVPDADLARWECPRFILQPIVENAIMHGFFGRRDTGYLRIWADAKNGRAALYVRDDGCGIERERLCGLNARLAAMETIEQREESIGLSNVHARLVMCCGAGAGLCIESVEGEYTLCVLTLGANA